MSDLSKRDPVLDKAMREYPELANSLVAFITEPAVIRLLEAGGQHEGRLVFNVRKGQVVSFVPELEMKIGYEISH